MYALDKQRFAALIGRLRREKGLTQRELAEKLYVSDKAVSKWETAVSIPDTALLIPLAEALGVTVTELLTGQRDAVVADTEEAVKTALVYSENTRRPAQLSKGWRMALYAVPAALMLLELLLLHRSDFWSADLYAIPLLALVFGGYFFLWARQELPHFYDENELSYVSDGLFRMHVPGLRFNSGNWPHLLRAGRIWAGCTMLLYLPLYWILLRFEAPRGLAGYLPMGLSLGSLIAAFYIVGRKHQ